MNICKCGHEKNLHAKNGLCIVGRFVPVGTPDDYPMCDCTEYREEENDGRGTARPIEYN